MVVFLDGSGRALAIALMSVRYERMLAAHPERGQLLLLLLLLLLLVVVVMMMTMMLSCW